MVLGFGTCSCGLRLERVTLMYLRRSDLAKLSKLCSTRRRSAVGGRWAVGEKVRPLSSNW